MKKRVCGVLLALVLTLGIVPGGAAAAEAAGAEEARPADDYAREDAEAGQPAPLAELGSGTWEGDEWYDEEAGEWKAGSGTWALDAAGTLTVEGTGAPPWDLSRQWDAYRDSIRRVEVGLGITEIKSDWFSTWYGESNGRNLTEAVFSDTVTTIGSHAFHGCAALAGVTLGKGITVIGNNAFQGTGLTSLTLPAGLAEIGEGAFAQCDQLDSIAVDKENTVFEAVDGVVFGGDGKTLALYPSGRRGAYTVPAGTERIGNSAFTGARGLTAVTLPAGVAEIGDGAFEGCDGLKEIAFPEGLQAVGNRAFSGCSALAEATFCEGLESIGEGAFSGCSALAKATFSEGLKTIGASAFYNCASLTEATLPDGLESIGGEAFSWCHRLKKAAIPGSLASLGADAFRSCYNLTDLTLGEGISRIENRAFNGCSQVQRLILPKSLTYIGSDVFIDAVGADIHFAGTEAEWEAVRLGYNALPEGLRVRCGSTGPVEPDLDGVKANGWPSYDWENKSTVWDLSLTIDNGGKAGIIAVQAALYGENGRFLDLRERALAVEPGEKTYDLGTLTFPGVDRGSVYEAKVFLTDAAALPLFPAL